MTLRFSATADAALRAAHAEFAATGEAVATWDRLAEVLTQLEDHGRLFSDLEGTPFDPPSAVPVTDGEEFFAIWLEPGSGPALYVIWSLVGDGDVVVHLIGW